MLKYNIAVLYAYFKKIINIFIEYYFSYVCIRINSIYLGSSQISLNTKTIGLNL